jgi:hypothetical protein
MKTAARPLIPRGPDAVLLILAHETLEPFRELVKKCPGQARCRDLPFAISGDSLALELRQKNRAQRFLGASETWMTNDCMMGFHP